MKKASTPTVVALFLAATLVPAASAFAQTTSRYPITPQQRSTADQVAQAGVPLSELSPNAPDSYTVKSGDTLWGISNLFLAHPWRWPELWGMNKDEIANPHLIYPGQTLYLDRSNGRARLRVGNRVGDGSGGGNGTVKMSPQVRIESTGGLPIPAIPASVIEPFLSQPLIINEQALATAPRVVATQESRLYTGRGDKIYARGMNTSEPATNWQVYRPAKPLLDPDTQTVIAYEAMYLGEAQVTRGGDPTTMAITTSKEEIGVGDRLVVATKPDFTSYVPRAANANIEARVVSIYGGGVNSAGGNMIVSFNRGSQQGIERGHVLRLYRYGQVIKDKTAPGETFKIPDEPVGYMFVFRVFDNISYGWIAESSNTIEIGDRVSSKLD